MQLEPKVAQDIVTNLKDIIHHEINLFDTTGTIIASTDEKRVGTFHDGAFQAVKSHQPVVIQNDAEFSGARAGTNLPVLFNDSVVAVIGITGDAEEVAPLGNIIKKMTEILIRENWSQMTRYTRQSNFNSLTSQLISQEHDESLVDYLMAVLEMDATIPRQVIVGQFLPADSPLPSYTEAGEVVPKYLSKHPASFYASSNNELTLMVQKTNETDLKRMLTSIQSEVKSSLGREMAFGIGRLVDNIGAYWQSYRDAKATVSWLLFKHQAVITHYDALDTALVLSALPDITSQDLRRKVLKDIPADELAEFKRVLAAYVDQNGSIIHGAAQLFIHKNTFQNKLNRIHAVTGYNPRQLSDFVVLYLAFALDDYDQFKQHQRL
ncbi:helix-turn-helix domain-containing protein [Lacticaseibacillus paracasei]|uniref:CdaR family transcriptional regulator n=1 Tax=Lacticaseibacillus paracasei TaxID=1597 RepID=UPI001BAA41FB|nr:sugar diacid recognition domain-containing protein [Lacticaseibacillus paracasei]MBS0992855.1 helix-turn-helix domain-containing protein [Lacticaseibacillus paracasei]